MSLFPHDSVSPPGSTMSSHEPLTPDRHVQTRAIHVSSAKNACPRTQHVPSIIVIGAGISGISAAQNLRNNSLTVTLVEARKRAGGRIHRLKMNPNLVSKEYLEKMNSPEILVQLGANWLHNTDEQSNPLFSVARFRKLALQQTSSDDNPGMDVLLFDPQNKAVNLLSVDDYQAMLSRYEWIRDVQIEKSFHELSALEECKQELSLQAIFDDAVLKSELVFGPCDDRMHRCLNWCADRISIDYGHPLSSVSASAWLMEGSDGDGGEALVVGGISQIFDAILAETPLDIEYENVVEIIEQDEAGVSVTCTNGKCYRADFCVVSVPIGVLKTETIKFVPPLSVEKQMALDHFDSHLMNLVILWYPFVFWPEGYNFLGVTHDTASEATFSTFLIPKIVDSNGNVAAVLVCQVFGDFAHQLEYRSKLDVAKEATDMLRRMINTNVPDAIGCEFSSWNSDPFAKGAWSVLKTGASLMDRHHLSKNENRVYFVGEHTADQFHGTLHGAFLSGKRESDKILDEISATCN